MLRYFRFHLLSSKRKLEIYAQSQNQLLTRPYYFVGWSFIITLQPCEMVFQSLGWGYCLFSYLFLFFALLPLIVRWMANSENMYSKSIFRSSLSFVVPVP